MSVSSKPIPLFSIGFRPFFLLAGLGALLPVLVWITYFAGLAVPAGHYGTLVWHAHELLFGYAVAVMAGFLLTAIRNWTGQPTAQGTALAVLALLWLAGRVVSLPWLALPGGVVALVDMLFLPALVIAVTLPLYRARQRRNVIFPLMLLLLALANGLLHASLLGWQSFVGAVPLLEAAVMVAIIMITVMAGRVFPFFTERGIAAPFKATIRPPIERLAVPLLVVFAVSWLWREQTAWLMPVCALLAAAVHGVRLFGWYTPHIWRAPLVWVLHVGYAWLVLGLLMAAGVGFDLLPFQLATHAFTAGTIGTVTLGMMARVALGHSGRPLQPSPSVSVAFALVALAAVFRTLMPAVIPAHYGLWMQTAGVLWCVAFVLFVRVYAPILVSPRADA